MPTPFVQFAIMKLPDDIRELFQKHGAKGGKKRARNMSSGERIESARNAARARWAAKKTAEQQSFKKSSKKSGPEV